MSTSETNRMLASASFVGLLIVIGLPLWWKTTEVYRVSLPYDKISEFDTQAHYITTELTVLANDEKTAAEVTELIEKAFKDYDVLNLKITKVVLPEGLRRSLDSVADEHEAVEEVGGAYDLPQHNKLYVVQRSPLFQDVWLGTERVVFFRDAKAANTLAKVLKQWIYEPSVLRGARSETADSTRRVRFPPGQGYHVVLSVVHPRPQDLKVELNAREAVEDYIGSFVDELSELHNFTLKSQWLYLLNFDFQATEVKEEGEWGRQLAVREERLHLLLTALEGRAATHVSDLPTLNLALYVLPCAQAPLVIYDSDNKKVSSPVQAFMSPKWGGVVFGNPSPAACATAPADASAPAPSWAPPLPLVMGTFIAQLRELLGITDKASISGAHLEALRAVSPRRWELDALLRLRTLEQLAAAHHHLRSLAQLLGEISNIVINDEVGAGINSAVTSSGAGRAAAERGALLRAYRDSLDAYLAAETAFMEPSLLALLYFPDDQKYAIYIPLFLPIMFPVVLSLKNLLLWLKKKPQTKEKTD
ncbi:PREDICTED: GPI transamidase component PIG-S isoform X2 [Papilio polytes]|uniref:GPI transamidase component PIG-S isoform X2 n=1 Tax=Papilio polytes TaxID=76194 RepID=UPI00067691D3|nr:PREDICTED: GPI transamidase component PIG-S isoform X2 [Papilio polytes]